MRAATGAVLAAMLVGCGDETAVDEPPVDCPSGQVVVDGRCEEPTPDDCPAGFWITPLGSCEPAGMSTDLCDDGFASGPDTPCRGAMPPEPCAPGTIAAVGETVCRPVMDCGEGPWGTLPVDAATVHVDQSYGGAGSDGSAAMPFTTISEALEAAPPGGFIAVAAGNYAEDLELDGPVQLWGRCPDLVEVRGSGAALATVLVLPAGDGSVVGGMAVTGPGLGVGVTGATLAVDQLWVHDTGMAGVDAVDDLGPAALSVTGTLIEAATGIGLRALRSSLELTDSMVLRTQPNPDGSSGRGVSLHGATATLVGSIVQDSHDVGLRMVGTSATVTGSIVRGTKAQVSDERFGRGVVIATIDGTAEASNVVMRNVALHDNRDVGLLLYGSSLEADNLFVGNTAWETATASGGYGINVQVDVDQALPSSLILRGGHVEVAHDAGLRVASSQASLAGLRVEQVRARPGVERFGYGVIVEAEPTTQLPGHADLTGCHLHDDTEVGLFVFDASATVDRTLVADTLPSADGFAGDGVVVLSQAVASAATITRSRVEGSARAAIGNFGALVTLGDNELLCQAFALNGEVSGAFEHAFDDQGGNRCGCPTADGDCKAVSSGLAPPAAID